MFLAKYFHKKFFYFAPIGGHWIFIALTRQYECEQYIDKDYFFHASTILDKKYENNVVFHRLILNYKVDTNQKTFQPLKLLLETKKDNFYIFSIKCYTILITLSQKHKFQKGKSTMKRFEMLNKEMRCIKINW